METEGGWCMHVKANPKKFTHRIICEACGKRFIATEKKNTIKEDILIYLDIEFRTVGNFFTSRQERIIGEKAISVRVKCPNCNYLNDDGELFAYPINQEVKGEWYNDIYQ